MEQSLNQEFKTFSLAIDMVRTIGQPPFEVVAGDTGNLLHVALTNDGVPVSLADAYVCVVFRSSIGTALQDETNGLTLSETVGEFSLLLLPESYGAGDVSADIQVYTGTDRATLITSRRFTFRCRNALLNDKTMQANGTYPPLISATHAATEAAAAAWAAAANNGDMRTAVYDTDGSGIVDDAEKLGGKSPEHYATAASVAAINPAAIGAAAAQHAARHAAAGSDPIAPSSIGAASLNANGKVSAEQASAHIFHITESCTLLPEHAGGWLYMDSSEAVTVTIPTELEVDFPVGTEIEVAQLGDGTVSFQATGAVIRSADDAVALSGKNTACALKKIGANTWFLAGALG